MLGRHVNWEEIALACGLEQISAELRRVGQYGFDAISRWLADTRGRRSVACGSWRLTWKLRSRDVEGYAIRTCS
jgi:hypothetical protein